MLVFVGRNRGRAPGVNQVVVTRRTALLGAGALAALGIGAGVGVAELAPVRRALGLVGPDGAVPEVAAVPTRTDRFASAARGRDVTMVTMRPAPSLPVCLLLYGRHSDARGMVELGLPSFLAACDRDGVLPFTVVALDGGDSYWVARTPADDPRAMLRAELPDWLAGLGLAAPRAVLGISMGGFGALAYVGTRMPTAVLSPAVFEDWRDARGLDAFADERQWARHEPLRHLDALPAGHLLGVWCGREDPFCPAARSLAAGARAEVAEFDHGAHTVGYWRRVLPAALRFVGRRLDG
ncbi:alpha/beta hydrolase [Pseudonocardia acaciae]|uniref:alpha/beta hydrolase n=1 Tax=Pseudonocardia acaciae TaxID=551276 RepID=UPI000A87988E|nr:alpha/beta hydrolase-fold protein [Pseudonocardia acaciae]